MLLGRSLKQLEDWAIENDQPAFRGRQLHEWLYQKGVKDIDAITVLPKIWRIALQKQGVKVGRLKEVRRLIATDTTTKLLLETADGENIETVGIPTEKRLTACVSSQIGCPMSCRFCATGQGGLKRSLLPHEIVDQVLSVRDAMSRRPSHVVFMGMGEPLLNIEGVLMAISCLNNDLGISQRRITLSTVGIPETLPRLANLALDYLGRVQFTLAVSLHAPNQRLREDLIPTARGYPIDKLLADCRKYFDLTGRRVSFEYILIGGVNDHLIHANELTQKLRDSKSHVNLIAYNPIDDIDFTRPSMQKIKIFRSVLEQNGLNVTLRASRGLDQNAACGQLRRHHLASV